MNQSRFEVPRVPTRARAAGADVFDTIRRKLDSELGTKVKALSLERAGGIHAAAGGALAARTAPDCTGAGDRVVSVLTIALHRHFVTTKRSPFGTTSRRDIERGRRGRIEETWAWRDGATLGSTPPVDHYQMPIGVVGWPWTHYCAFEVARNTTRSARSSTTWASSTLRPGPAADPPQSVTDHYDHYISSATTISFIYAP